MIVLSIVGSLVLLVGLACGGFFFWGMRNTFTELPAARDAATSFLDDLKTDRIEAAHGRTTQSFQNTQPIDQFTAFINRYAVLKTQTSRSITGVHVHHQPGRTTARVRVTVLDANNSLSFTLTLLREDDEWKVHAFTIP